MRLGILTLHDSVNYGALAQAYALRFHLSSLGHDAVVIDRRRDPSSCAVRTPFRFRDTCRAFGLFRADAHNCERESSVRVERTLRFLSERVGLTRYSFHDWRDAPCDLGVDAIVVGSDQVWNANNLDPNDYLLRDTPKGIPGIAYAASVGMPEFPRERLDDYRRGFARFVAIGARERSAAELVRSLGVEAAHVADPVLLAGTAPWDGIVADRVAKSGRVFAYFLAEDFPAMFGELGRFAALRGGRVDFFCILLRSGARRAGAGRGVTRCALRSGGTPASTCASMPGRKSSCARWLPQTWWCPIPTTPLCSRSFSARRQGSSCRPIRREGR